MSSFVSLRPTARPLRIGNPTFKLILRQMNDKKHTAPSIARIVEANPIADCIGFLNLEAISSEDINAFCTLVDEIFPRVGRSPLTEAGFDIRQDLVRFSEELKTQIPTFG